MIVGLCHGCFDILHFGHIRHFQAAKKLCDKLCVSVTADEFVNKGPDRPVFTLKQRMETISALSCVDWVEDSPHPTGVEVMESLKPNILFKGSDYTLDHPALKEEREVCEHLGIKIVFTNEDTSSSTEALRRLRGER